MKTPPMLVGAALLFWGWQTGFFVVAIVMAVVLEGSRFVKLRWELSNEDFARIWTFCALVLLATLVYAFAENNGPANVREILSNGDTATQVNLGNVSAKTAVLLIRWLPLVFFLFIAAQAFSSREAVPLEFIHLLLRRRWKKLKKSSASSAVAQSVNVAYPYFIICLFAASTWPQAPAGQRFFPCLCGLVIWALWPYRSRRFNVAVWATAIVLAIALGFSGQRGLVQLQRAIIQYNPQWLADFIEDGFDPLESRTEIGQIGRIKTSHTIVLRLKRENGSMPPPYLREAAYRVYKSGIWYSGNAKDDFVDVNDIPRNSGNYPLFESRTNPGTLNIACFLPGGKGLLPLPTDAARLEKLQAIFVQKNRVGTVHVQGPGLVIFDALYGNGTSMDFPPETNEDLFVFEKERPALDQVISELHVDGANEKKALQAIGRFFASRFTYSLWQDAPHGPETNTTPIGRFLLKSRRGHCEYFATATVLLLRELGIPARYTVGYAVHEKSGKGFVVRRSDAHAWCRVWNDAQKRWENFDTTPSSWIQAEGQTRSWFQFISDAWSRLVFEFSRFRWGQSPLRQLLPWLMAPALVLLLYQIIFRSNARRVREKFKVKLASRHRPGLDSEFYQLERALAQRGVIRPPGEPLSDWLRRMANTPGMDRLNEPLGEILQLHYRYRFDPRGLTAEHRERLRHEVASCLEHVAALNGQ